MSRRPVRGHARGRSLIAARYRILDPLGRGGMGAVYHAHDEVLDEDVALKILRPEVAGTPEMAARFRSEIKLARKVSHWNVCRIHEYGEDGGLQYISMELITGATLKDRLRAGPLPAPDKAFDVAIQIADGLAAIHKVGIVHRDLKSANVMVDAAGTAKVMDFGIAKAAADGGSATGYVLGSPEYMSPEQARGRRADFRSDLYSLGIVVFEAFTGRVPFRGPTPVATLLMHVEAPPPVDDPPLALPRSWCPSCAALAKDPADRFADAPAMAAALRAAKGGGAISTPPSTDRRPGRESCPSGSPSEASPRGGPPRRPGTPGGGGRPVGAWVVTRDHVPAPSGRPFAVTPAPSPTDLRQSRRRLGPPPATMTTTTLPSRLRRGASAEARGERHSADDQRRRATPVAALADRTAHHDGRPATARSRSPLRARRCRRWPLCRRRDGCWCWRHPGPRSPWTGGPWA